MTKLIITVSHLPHPQHNHLGSRMINFGKITFYWDRLIIFEVYDGQNVEEVRSMIANYCQGQRTDIISIEEDDS
ncbi:MAG: hypothetical protein ACTSRU_01785 [Candidatus Hodarchaeales archaeon]